LQLLTSKPHAGKGTLYIAGMRDSKPGMDWHMLFRLYGPEQAWFDQTWRPGEIELVE